MLSIVIWLLAAVPASVTSLQLPINSTEFSYNATQTRIPLIINFHLFKSGGTHAEKIYATARDQVCGPGTAQNLARSFPLACDPHYRRPWVCGVHFTWPAAQSCLARDRRAPVGQTLSLQSDLVTSVIILRDPVERYVSEFHHRERYHTKHCMAAGGAVVKPSCKLAPGSLTGFRALGQGLAAVTLSQFLRHNCTGAENRLVWTMARRFNHSGAYSASCKGNLMSKHIKVGNLSDERAQEQEQLLPLWDDPVESEAVYREALVNLRAVSVVGTLAHLERVFMALGEAFNVSFNHSQSRERKEHQQYQPLDHRGGGQGEGQGEEGETLVAVRKRVALDQRLVEDVLGSRTLRVNWDSWLGRKLTSLGLKTKYSA